MSAEIGTNALLLNRRAVQRDLIQLRFEIVFSNRRHLASFSPEEAEGLTSFFFDKVMGFQGLI
jgi:hypothetical protein